MDTRTPQTYARALYEITANKRGAALEKAIRHFAALLARERALRRADRIIGAFIHYAKAQEGIAEIHIESAFLLDGATVGRIKKIFGEKAEATTTRNARLLGGVVVRSRDTIFDASAATQLRNLTMKLAS
ncbi:MAG: F0F1 ATP synthase subunit delta [Parcubacteria group bacterium]|nr:F0F1 ATP synthase subunit delta [Parcubacteria group bacterium]